MKDQIPNADNSEWNYFQIFVAKFLKLVPENNDFSHDPLQNK